MINHLRQDFTNMVVFCLKPSDNAPPFDSPAVRFRQPTMDDYLGSAARRSFLEPKHEVYSPHLDGTASTDGDLRVLFRNETARMNEWQQRSAQGHWAVMRSVISPDIWDQW